MEMMDSVRLIRPGEFEAHDYWYPKALNATIHPIISFFLNLDQSRLINRYTHLHPAVNRDRLKAVLSYETRYYHWAGADLINVTSAGGKRQMVVIENNSCPSGQKSMPLLDDHDEQGGYRFLIEQSFKPFIERRGLIKGYLAVIYDKNKMEASGYASAMADAFDEPVLLIPFHDDKRTCQLEFKNSILYYLGEKEPTPLRAVFRYVTQKPWNRIPPLSKTRIFNPIAACLAGGRNKLLAAKAYTVFNTELADYGLKITIPETIWDVSKAEIPLWVGQLGGHAVIKVPYSNAGQGVFTITSQKELDDFMNIEFYYDRFIVQSLIGNYQWSSRTSAGKFYHLGTIPNSKGSTYVFDLRMMVCSTRQGIRPICIYSRRAQDPLPDLLDSHKDSWSMLGTNLSHKTERGLWETDTNRLLLMDRRDFNRLGLSLDDLIEAYIQTVLSTIAIDKMAQKMFTTKGQFRIKFFSSINEDRALINELKLE
jgi:hypothetical protein